MWSCQRRVNFDSRIACVSESQSLILLQTSPEQIANLTGVEAGKALPIRSPL